MKSTSLKRPRRTTAETLPASRQQEILDAAAFLFAKHGYADTDTQLLADKLGVGKGTLYRYFPSKEALFLAAADRVMRDLCGAVDASIADISDPIEEIAEAIRAYLAYCADHPECVEL